MRAEPKIVMERKKLVRDVPNFRFKRVTKISALLSFIHNFHLKMATHEIGAQAEGFSDGHSCTISSSLLGGFWA